VETRNPEQHGGEPTGAVNLDAKFASFTEHWAPRLVATYNGNDVRIVKAEGEFVWHKHDDTDDFFLVLEGVLDIELRDRTVTLGPGELFVVPRGVEHRPVALRGEVRMINIEPGGTHNLGEGSPQRPVVEA
jgi:mannose-6-phosphate isomerase-like protein (cupin superfamily)